MRILLPLAVMMLIFLSSCSKVDLTSPQIAFDTYQDAINSNNYGLIEKTTTKAFRLQMIENGNDLRNISQYFKKAGLKSADCKITLFEQSHPEIATIGCTAIYDYLDGTVTQSYKEEYFTMVKEGKDWKVHEYKAAR